MTGQITVLHVDDEPDVLDLSSNVFERQGGSVSILTAENGSDGLGVLSTHDVDCVVSDSVRMPDGESFIEAASRVTDAPIVLFTAKEWQDVADDAIAADVTEYVRKADGGDYKTILRHVLRLVDERGSTDGMRRLVGQHDFASPGELGVAIVESVERVLDTDATELEPLYETIDPDALERLFEPAGAAGTPSDHVEVRFNYEGLDLVVSGDGSICLDSSASFAN